MEQVANLLFPPLLESSQATEQLQHLVAQAPANFAQPGVRWKLATIQNSISWLQGLTLSGVWRQLERAKISLKHARHYVHSPDLQYLEKLAEIVRVLELVAQSNSKIVLLFADELTFYRQPTLSFAYTEKGKKQAPKGILSHRSNTQGRIGGVVNAVTGEVTYQMASKFGITEHLKLYEQLKEVYQAAEVIYLVEDNCPIHFHPTVLNALVEQETPFELKIPPSWAKVVGKKWKKEKLPIQILPLPTYASWCNPIEKLWRWLKQEVIHLHRKADDWDNLKEEIRKFLDKFRAESANLLKYIGLTENSKLYGATLSLLTGKQI